MKLNDTTTYHPTVDGGIRMDCGQTTLSLSVLEREKIVGGTFVPASHSTITLGADCIVDLRKDLKYMLDKMFPGS